jgi:hypothetical protein
VVYVYPSFTKDYFLYLLLQQNTRLEDLDDFLRDIWLECCGHMSAFFVDRFQELPNNYTISQVEDISNKLLYHYDFGSTTELNIDIIGKYKGPLGLKTKIVILARNRQPLMLCDECGKREAVSICVECLWDGAGLLCVQCAKRHEHDEMFKPVCNSPRMGVCGYMGEKEEIRTDAALDDFLGKLRAAQQS